MDVENENVIATLKLDNLKYIWLKIIAILETF